jgi:hypothetical protein
VSERGRKSNGNGANSAPGSGIAGARGYRARGRPFTARQLLLIKDIVKRYFPEGRTRISFRVCSALRWRQRNGAPKDMACREVLRRLDAAGLLDLPPAKWGGAVWCHTTRKSSANVVTDSIMDLDFHAVEVHRICSKSDPKAALWNSLVTEHHYLHSSRLVGRHLKYLYFWGDRPIACFGWGDAAWSVACREKWIGWTQRQIAQRRHLIVSNGRFLILPWVHVPNLASHLIARCTAALVRDWEEVYGYRPVLLETFVDISRFSGTCYRAANWSAVGNTSGYAKTGGTHHNSQLPKLLLMYPTARDFRKLLRGCKK